MTENTKKSKWRIGGMAQLKLQVFFTRGHFRVIWVARKKQSYSQSGCIPAFNNLTKVTNRKSDSEVIPYMMRLAASQMELKSNLRK